MKRLLWIPWRWWRRAAQLLLLLLFLWLFRRTAYTGSDELAGGEHMFFHLDPLATLSAMLSSRQWIPPLWPAVIVVLLTVLLGRFFCGWVCPLGTLLDWFHRLLRPITRRANRLLAGKKVQVFRRTGARYVLLIVVLLSAALACPLIGLFDPLALLTRGLTFWGDPLFYRGADAVLQRLGEGRDIVAFDDFVRKSLMPFRSEVFQLAGLSAALLGVIFALEFVARRFWCRYLCPLGALLGLCSRRSLVRRLPAGACKTCGHCAEMCRMDALGDGLSVEDCTLCMDCVDLCPKRIARFAPAKTKTPGRPVDLSRRGVLVGLALGAATAGSAATARVFRRKAPDPHLIRPPGAAENDRDFLNLCIRCGECMKVCPNGVLQPAGLETGIEGVFAPRLVPRLVFEQTFCDYNCTLCGQVCPTGALKRLTAQEKHARPLGKAYFDRSRCLPWAMGIPCARCEEMCPTPDKAIKFLHVLTITTADGREVELQQPYVDRTLCVGCGICESNCPVPGESAIRVRRIGAPDPGTEG
jgi:polyferredoxin